MRPFRADLGATPDDYVCIMTRGHVGDYDVQRQMLAIKPLLPRRHRQPP